MKKLISYILIALVLLPNFSYAADYKLLEPLPCVEGTGNNCTPGSSIPSINLDTYINYVFKFAIALAAFLAVVMIIWGGFQVMVSEIPFVKASGKDKIWNAIIGLVMVLASYLILQTIDPRLVQINTTIAPIKIDTSGVKGFQDKLQNDLNALNAENQLKYKELAAQKSELDKQTTDLKSKWERGEITDDEYAKESVKINEQQAGVAAAKTNVSAENEGLNSFKTALNLIHNVEGADRNSLDAYIHEPSKDANTIINGKYPPTTGNEIADEYNRRLNELLKITPRTDDVNTLIKQLGNEKNFYITQVKEENDLYNRIDIYKGLGPALQKGSLVEKNLNKGLTQYQEKLKDPKRAEGTGLPVEQYDTLLNDRITKINAALGKTAK